MDGPIRKALFSYAHQRRDVLGESPLREKAGALTQTFEGQRRPAQPAHAGNEDGAARARQQRRESFMIKRQRPQPVLRPSRGLAYETDKRAFQESMRRDNDP